MAMAEAATLPPTYKLLPVVRMDSGSVSDGPMGKRDERRERMRLRREDEVRTVKLGMLGVNAGVVDDGVPGSPRMGRIRTAKKEILGLGQCNLSNDVLEEKRKAGTGGQGGSPFPGRQAFLDMVRKLKDDN
jgi:hypothetical protein